MTDEPDPLWYDREEPRQLWGRAMIVTAAELMAILVSVALIFVLYSS